MTDAELDAYAGFGPALRSEGHGGAGLVIEKLIAEVRRLRAARFAYEAEVDGYRMRFEAPTAEALAAMRVAADRPAEWSGIKVTGIFDPADPKNADLVDALAPKSPAGGVLRGVVPWTMAAPPDAAPPDPNAAFAALVTEPPGFDLGNFDRRTPDADAPTIVGD